MTEVWDYCGGGRRRSGTKNRALGVRGQSLEKTEDRETERPVFRPLDGATAPQTHLSSVPYPLSSEPVFCPLKPLSSERREA
ncbi:MAG: hypothetical protein LBD06_02680 [Candidatus Accumulibacter sp.]|nr:hypothetical protein [Accumulibacter sp.]